MKGAKIVTISGSLVLCATACMWDDNSLCPPASGPVTVTVVDKNYDNAAETGATLLDENLPMLSYIGTLTTHILPAGASEHLVNAESVPAEARTFIIPSARFSKGLNEVAAVALERAAARSGDEEFTALHPEGGEGDDVYIGGGDVTFPTPGVHVIGLLRTKGKLSVEVEGIPSGTSSVTISVGNVYAGVNTMHGEILYGGLTVASKTFSSAVRSTDATGTFEMVVAPSGAETSPVTISLAGPAKTVSTMPFSVSIVRNGITMVHARYDAGGDSWRISVMIDGVWRQIEELTLS